MKNISSISVIVAMSAIALAGAYGWVCNIITILSLDGFSGEMAVRIAGVFIFPVGAVAGYL